MPLVESSILKGFQPADPMGAMQRGMNMRQGLVQNQRENQSHERIQKFQGALSEVLGSGVDYKTPEGQTQLLDGLAQRGFGPEAMELAQKFPKPAEAPQDQWNTVPNAADPTLYNQRNGEIKTLGVKAKPTGPTEYDIAKDKWDREFKERQLKQSGANTAKDNEIAAAKFELAKNKTEAEMAKKATDVTEVSAQADEAVSLIDQMIGSEDGETKRHPGFTSAVGSRISFSTLGGLKPDPIGGTDAADFQALYEQVKGGAFLEAVSKMKGSGALSDTEGKAATSAISRMKTSQSEGEFMRAAKEFRTAIKGRKGRMVAKAASGAPGMTAPAPAASKLTKNADGSFDYNPGN